MTDPDRPDIAGQQALDAVAQAVEPSVFERRVVELPGEVKRDPRRPEPPARSYDLEGECLELAVGGDGVRGVRREGALVAQALKRNRDLPGEGTDILNSRPVSDESITRLSTAGYLALTHSHRRGPASSRSNLSLVPTAILRTGSGAGSTRRSPE